MGNELREECGVFGMFSPSGMKVSAQSVYYGLFALQHRGQEGCGIVINKGEEFESHKDIGLVNEVFTPEILDELGVGNIAVGHVRYGTTGANNRSNCQPIEVHHVKGTMALAHNGNLTNAGEIRQEQELNGSIFHTTSDTEIIAYAITNERLSSVSIEDAIVRIMDKIQGAYSLIIMTSDKLIAVRDKNGMRPLCYGKLDDGCYVIASESCALDAVGADMIRDVRPGEIMVFSNSGVRSITSHCKKAVPSMCVFEYIYFARPDSVIDGVSVQAAHMRAGAFLAQEHPVDADVVIGVPDSGIDAALGYAQKSRIPYGIGFVKNKYIGRTFIAPQPDRANGVKLKLSPVENAVKGKRVVLVDDSIVRGTTSRHIVNLLREAGAKEVHMRISSPPFLNPCYYGTDIDSRDMLIACNHTVEEVSNLINADSLGYLSLEHAEKLAEGGNCSTFCTACFSGRYPTEIPTKQYKNKFEYKISERVGKDE